jgi:hypothetical protein
MNKLLLQAQGDNGKVITQEIPGPRYEVRAWHLKTNTQGVLGVYNTPCEALVKHFQLCARYDLRPYWN